MLFNKNHKDDNNNKTPGSVEIDRMRHKGYKYLFEWEPKGKPVIIPASLQKLAMEIADSGRVSIYNELQGGKIFIKIPDCCRKSDETAGLEEYDDNTEANVRAGFYSGKATDTTLIPIDTDFNPGSGPVSFCRECCAAACPYVLAARIIYLRDNGLSEPESSESPVPLRYKNSYQFAVRDSYLGAVATVTDRVYENARFLADNCCVSLMKKMTTDENNVHYASVSMSFDYRLLENGGGKRSVRDVALSNFKPSVLKTTDLIAGPHMPEWKQSVILGGMLHLADCTMEDISEYMNIRESVIPEFRKLAASVKGLERILAIAENEKTSYLRCTIEGDYERGRDKTVKAIAGILAKKNKIDSTEVFEVSFGQLAEEFSENQNCGESYQNDEEYPHHKTYGGYIHRTFEKRKLYAVTDLDRFLRDRAAGKEAVELSQIGLEWLVKVLGMLEKDTYVIIVGYSNEVDRFLAIDSRIGFLFGSNRLKYPDMRPDELFDMYMEGLSKSVTAQIKDRSVFKKEFEDYIAFNSRALPFDNDELAEYLSEYSNTEGKPILPPGVYDAERVKNKLGKIVGMTEIKEQITEFGNYIAFRKKAEAQGVKLPESNLHMLFTGNPGTGKTMIARIVAGMLYDIGFLPEDKLVEVERKDLVAGYLGQTAAKTAAKINEALGGVLFIDEAYSLTGDPYGAEAISTLLKAMEDYRSRLVIIFAGYVDEMQKFTDSNPGLASRIGYKFHFDDYSQEELIKILLLKSDSAGMKFTPGAIEKVGLLINYFRRQKNFGNGRFIDKLWQEILIKHSARENAELLELGEDDIPPIGALSTRHSSPKKEMKLDDLIGLKQVKEQVERFRTRVAFEVKGREFGIDIPRGNSHMLFLGSAGTGKTTVARILRDELYNAGIITERKITEVTAKDLIAEYVGQTSPKTQAVIDRAMGGILFIDECYQLASTGAHSFGQDAVTTLIKAMEDCKDQFVVIMAGYEKEMREFLEMNTGIASRIGYTFYFEDYNAEELTAIYRLKIEGAGLVTDNAETLSKVKSVMQYFLSVPNFGNGRFAEKLSSIVFEQHALNCSDTDDRERLVSILPEDIPSVEHIIALMPDSNMLKPSEVTEKQNERTAVHELGHALASVTLFPEGNIEKITIAAEGSGALGYVSSRNLLGTTSTAEELKNLITVFMAGIAAEKAMLGDYTNGGGSDLEKATEVAWKMISSFGMSRNGFAVKETRDESAMSEINQILRDAFDRACNMVSDKQESMNKARVLLLERKTISEEEFRNLI